MSELLRPVEAAQLAGVSYPTIITSDAARSLGLEEGVSVFALIKATEVMVIRG